MRAKIPVKWKPWELTFILDNYYTMSWNELISALNSLRSENVNIGALRHVCIRLGLAKQIQIRWSKEDIQFLLDNYKIKGNVEIAEILTKKGRSFRLINGKKVVRKFVPKNIEKKMNLFGLERTKEDLDYIIKHNREIGKGYCWTKEKNVYTEGIKQVFEEGEIRIWHTGEYKTQYIKINGRFTQYSRYLYRKHYGSIPKGHKIRFKDGNTLNCVIENLECVSCAHMAQINSYHRYPIELKRTIRTLNKLNKTITNYEKD